MGRPGRSGRAARRWACPRAGAPEEAGPSRRRRPGRSLLWNGIIVDPAGLTSTVGVRPTLGVASRTGIVPISSRHDTPGPVARNVTDAALTLAAIAGTDPA
ncbi:amidase family protein, partial [Streptomyces clavuligerus]|uniref:amidase family protein n=1 Tax=Streptomyces clavuligerus TaxID=1901 RepID=UPI0027DA3B49